MEVFGLLIILAMAWVVLESRIAMGEEKPWAWQKSKEKPPF